MIVTNNPPLDFLVGKNDNMILTLACHSKTQQSRLSAGYVNRLPVTLLRDTGCKNIVARKSLVLKDQFTNEHVTCLLADTVNNLSFKLCASSNTDSDYLEVIKFLLAIDKKRDA